MYKVGSEEWNEMWKAFAREEITDELEVTDSAMKYSGEEYELPKYESDEYEIIIEDPKGENSYLTKGTEESVNAYYTLVDERVKHIPTPYISMISPEWLYLWEYVMPPGNTNEYDGGKLSDDYKKVAKRWGWWVVLHVYPEETAGVYTDAYILMGLYHGECRRKTVRFISEKFAYKQPYVIHGTYDQWSRIQEGSLRLIKALMRGEMSLEGDLKRMMRESKASRILVDLSKLLESNRITEIDEERFNKFSPWWNKLRLILKV
jgi:putative sterol carrier protein